MAIGPSLEKVWATTAPRRARPGGATFYFKSTLAMVWSCMLEVPSYMEPILASR
jgi:hypothetical protein